MKFLGLVFLIYSSLVQATPVQIIQRTIEKPMKGKILEDGQSFDLKKVSSKHWKVLKVKVNAKSEQGYASLYLVHYDMEGELHPVAGQVDQFIQPGFYHEVVLPGMSDNPHGNLILNAHGGKVKLNSIAITFELNRPHHNYTQEKCTSKLMSHFIPGISFGKFSSIKSEYAYPEEEEKLRPKLYKKACKAAYKKCKKKVTTFSGTYCSVPK